MLKEEDQEKPNGLGIEEYSRDTTATAGRKELRGEELFFRNISVDYELDQNALQGIQVKVELPIIIFCVLDWVLRLQLYRD